MKSDWPQTWNLQLAPSRHNWGHAKEKPSGFSIHCSFFYGSKDSEERIGDGRIQLHSSCVQDSLVDFFPCQKQELVAFKFIKSTELQELYAPMQISNPLLQGGVNKQTCYRSHYSLTRSTAKQALPNFKNFFFYLKCSIGEPDLSKFLLIRIFSNVSNVSKECLKCPLHFGIIILSQKWVCGYINFNVNGWTSWNWPLHFFIMLCLEVHIKHQNK